MGGGWGTCEDDVGYAVSTVSSAVVLVVEHLLLSGLLGLQAPLAVEGELVLVVAAAAQPAVVQGQTVHRVLSRELVQKEELLDQTSHMFYTSDQEQTAEFCFLSGRVGSD